MPKIRDGTEGIDMTRTEGNVNQWVEIFANFRKGSVLTEIIKEEEPFIREPYWLSPLFEEDYRRYHTFEIEGISRGEQFPFEGDGPWIQKLYATLCGIQQARIPAPEGWIREIR